jgi:hypothetical protein
MTASFFAEVPNFFSADFQPSNSYHRGEYMTSPSKTFTLLGEKTQAESLSW